MTRVVNAEAGTSITSRLNHISYFRTGDCCNLSAIRNATLVNTYFINHYTGITIIHMTRQYKSYCSSAKVGKVELVTNTECRSLRQERLVVIIVHSPRWRRYTIRFARTEPADCPVHGSLVTCDMSIECPGHMKIG